MWPGSRTPTETCYRSRSSTCDPLPLGAICSRGFACDRSTGRVSSWHMTTLLCHRRTSSSDRAATSSPTPSTTSTTASSTSASSPSAARPIASTSLPSTATRFELLGGVEHGHQGLPTQLHRRRPSRIRQTTGRDGLSSSVLGRRRPVPMACGRRRGCLCRQRPAARGCSAPST